MQKALPFIVFAIVLGFARILGSMAPETFGNFQPLGALLFCGMALFGWRGLILPALAWIITLPFTNIAQGYVWYSSILTPLLGFAAMIALARLFRNSSPGKVFLGSLAGAVAVYLVTNTLSWVSEPLYGAKSFATWIQALTIGLPQFAIPTWVFFRNALLAQGLFSALFLLATRTAPFAWKSRSVPAAS
jgi:hypothetical protein